MIKARLEALVLWVAVLWSVATLSFTCAASTGSDDLYADLDPVISYVVIGGYWISGDSSGAYRGVVTRYGQEHLSYRAFIEWLTYDEQRDKDIVLERVSVSEFNEMEMGSVTDIEIRQDDWNSQAILVLYLRDEYTQRSREYRVTLMTPGKYAVCDAVRGDGNRRSDSDVDD